MSNKRKKKKKKLTSSFPLISLWVNSGATWLVDMAFYIIKEIGGGKKKRERKRKKEREREEEEKQEKKAIF